jgi:hypothetical protein
MGSLTDYAEIALGNHIIGEGAYAHVATTYCALFTVDPDDTAGWTEVVVGGGTYARQTITWHAATIATRNILSDGALVFAAVGAAFGDVHGVGIMDGAVEGAGNMLAWAVVAQKTVADGETYTIADHALTVTVEASGAGGGMHSAFAAECLDFLFRNTDIADRDGGTHPWVALFTANPADLDATDGTEVAVGASNYARIQAAFSIFAGAGGGSDNDAQLDWVCAGANYGTVSGMGLMKTTTEAATDCMFWFDNVEGDAVIDIGDTFQVVAGGLDIVIG